MGPIKPGDRFFRVMTWRRREECDWVVVTKVGRRWAEFQVEARTWRHKENRFDIETLKVDGGQFSSPGRVYRSEEEYRDSVHRQALWSDLRRQVDRQYQPPDNLTAIDILKGADALGFRLKEE